MAIRDEFEFIKKISPTQVDQRDVVVGIGDDAAIVRPQNNMDLIVCTDTMVEDIHFKRETMSSFQIGYKALAANISDIAAMGGIPTYYLVSIVIPKQWDEAELLEIYQGMEALATQYQMVLIGGDTVSTSGPLVVNVTVMGKIEKSRSLKRSNARPGDIVFLTGTVGDSAAGLHILLSDKTNKEQFQSLVLKHQMPVPQVEAGRVLTEFKTVAANDISDGVASEANEIAEASKVDLYLEEGLIPLSKDIREYGRDQALNWALFGGEDYQLIGTTSLEQWAEIEKLCKEKNMMITKIGEVHQGTGKVWLRTAGQLVNLQKKGYNHFNHGGVDEKS